jgi:hypothetical protein
MGALVQFADSCSDLDHYLKFSAEMSISRARCVAALRRVIFVDFAASILWYLTTERCVDRDPKLLFIIDHKIALEVKSMLCSLYEESGLRALRSDKVDLHLNEAVRRHRLRKHIS